MDSSFGRTLLWLTAILGAIGLLLYLFVFDTWVVPSDDPLLTAAIAPTLSPDDRILTRRGSTPITGELARCYIPDGSGKFTIGRVFGSGGDSVEINNERVAVNGVSPKTRFSCGIVSIVHPVSGDAEPLTCTVEDNGSFTYGVLAHPEFREGQRLAKVEPGKVWLVSDNRHIHKDSRDFGSVDASACEHVVFRLWGQTFGDASHRFNVLW
ncbi:MAG: signal peptidase [Myxococcales bacterium]|nr:signal peptidase [Myxococcales bacterium]